jgi:hypothetical protein
MNRRLILKSLCIGPALLMALTTLAISFSGASPPERFRDVPARRAASAPEDSRRVGFRFVSNSRTATVGGVRYLAIFNGDGKIADSEVEGGGYFDLIVDTSPVPKTIVASGTWKAKTLTSFTLIGTYGAIAAGILLMKVDLVPDAGPVVEASLRVACDIVAAGLDFGEVEGFVLDIPGHSLLRAGRLDRSSRIIRWLADQRTGFRFLTRSKRIRIA